MIYYLAFNNQIIIIYIHETSFCSFLFAITKDKNREIKGRKVENTNIFYSIATLSLSLIHI